MATPAQTNAAVIRLCGLRPHTVGRNGEDLAMKPANTYNLNLHRWEQYWVDNSAGTIFFYGNLEDGVMDYWTDAIPQSNGQKLRRHLQFFNLGPGKVRQFSQGSTDGERPGRLKTT
jgi:hypothetical protein